MNWRFWRKSDVCLDEARQALEQTLQDEHKINEMQSRGLLLQEQLKDEHRRNHFAERIAKALGVTDDL